MNKCTIIGNLTADPKVRSVATRDGNTTVCNFTVAVNNRHRGENGQNDAQFFNVTAWRGLGDNCVKFLSKGRKACVVGPVSARTYQTQSGETRVSLEITAEDVEFLSARDEQDGQAALKAAIAGTQNFTPVDTDELPF